VYAALPADLGYLRSLMTTQNITSNLAYVLVLNDKPLDWSSITFLQTVVENQRVWAAVDLLLTSPSIADALGTTWRASRTHSPPSTALERHRPAAWSGSSAGG
jgi:hypothetical protein